MSTIRFLSELYNADEDGGYLIASLPAITAAATGTFVNPYPSSYFNYGGSGNRPHIIKGSTDISLSWGAVDGLLNGAYTNDMRFSDNQAVSGKYIQFEFIEPVVIVEAKWYQDGSTANGTWKWQGSNNGSNWDDIGSSFILGGALIQTQTQLISNTTKYKYYRLFGVSGTTSINDYVQEIEFRIGANTQSYLSAFGFGNRTTRITASQDCMAGAASYLVDGTSGANIYFNIGAVANHYIKFDFGTPIRLLEAVYLQQNTAAQGTWKWQGSTNNADWVDIGSSFALGGATEQFLTELNGNTATYRYYRLFGVSGNASSSPYVYEFLFKIAKTPSGLGNNFTNDATCKALWRFENNLTDIIGWNDLTAGGGGVSYTSSSPLEGSYALDNEYDTNQGAYRHDANLGIDFPFKARDTVKRGTVCVRLRPESHYAKNLAIWMKSYYYSSSSSNSVGLVSNDNQLRVLWGDGSVNQYYNTGIYMTDGQDYHVAVAIDGIARTLYVRVYDYTAGQVYTYSTSPSNELPVCSVDFEVGRFSDAPSTQNWDGLVDELVVFNRVLSDYDIDLIRRGEYGEDLPIDQRLYHFTESLGEYSTVETSYQNKATLTFTPGDNEAWLIVTSWILKSDYVGGSGYNAWARLYRASGTPATLMEQSFTPRGSTNEYHSGGAAVVETFGDSPGEQTYKVQWKATNSGYAAYIKDVKITAIRLEVHDKFAADITESSTTDNSYQNKLSLTFAPHATGDYIIIGCAKIHNGNDAFWGGYRLLQDGTTDLCSFSNAQYLGNTHTWLTVAKVNLNDTQHVFTQQWKGFSWNNIYISDCYIIALRCDDFPNVFYANSNSGQTTGLTTYQDKVTLSQSLNEKAHLVLGTSIGYHSATTSYEGIQFTQDGNALGEMIFNPRAANSSYPYVSSKLLAANATNYTWKHQWKALTADTAGISFAEIAVLELGPNPPLPDYYYNECLVETSTNNVDVWVDKCALSFTPGANEKWLIVSSWLQKGGYGGLTAYTSQARLRRTSPTLKDLMYHPKAARNTGEWMEGGCFYVEEFGADPGEQTYKLQHVCIGWSAYPSYMKEATIFAIKLSSDTLFDYAIGRKVVGNSTWVADTWRDICNITFTPGGEQDYIILASGALDQVSATGACLEARITVDGTPYSQTLIAPNWSHPNDWRTSYLVAKKVTLDGTEHDIKIQLATATSSYQSAITFATLLVIPAAHFPHLYYAESESRSTTTQTTYQDKLTLTNTLTAKEHLLLACAGVDTTNQKAVYADVAQDDIGMNEQIAYPWTTGRGLPYAAARLIDADAQSYTWDLQYKHSDGTSDAGIQDAHISVLQLEDRDVSAQDWPDPQEPDTPTPYDDFTGTNGSDPNPAKWTVTESAHGVVDIQNNQLRVAISGATGAETSYAESVFQLIGDFDVQVEFSLSFSPDDQSFYCGLIAVDQNNPSKYYTVRRVRGTWHYMEGGWYDSSFSSNSIGYSDNTGKMRMRRVGTVIYLMYYDSYIDDWSEITCAEVSTANFKIRLQSSTATDTYPNVDMRFDNLIIESGLAAGVSQHDLQVLSRNDGINAHELVSLSRNDGIQQHSLYVLSMEQSNAGVVSANLEKITASGTGIVNVAGSLNATLAKVVAAGTGWGARISGVLHATLKKITASSYGGQIKENYFDLNLEVSGRKRRYEFPQDDRDRIGDADIEEPETSIAALVPVVTPAAEEPKTPEEKVNDLANDATLLITRSNDILDILLKVCANLTFAVPQGDMVTRSALLALHLDQDKMSFSDYLDILRLQVELATHVGQTTHVNEVMTNAGSQSETAIKFYESNLQNNISDAAVWAMQAKPIVKSSSTGQAVNDFLNSYNDYPVNNTIVDAMGGESQTTLGRIIAECIPCLQRTLSMSNFNPLEEILNLLQAEITKRLNYLQSLWNSLINGQTINICDLMNFLNSMCIPDLFAVLASLSHYWLQLTDLHKTNVWGILWSLVQPLLQGLLMNFTSLIDRFLRLIMAPVECVITSIDHEYAKLYNLGHMEMREKQGLVVNPPYSNNFSKWAHDQIINPAFNAKGPFGTSLLELKKALQNSNGWVNSQIKRLRDAIAEMLGQDGSALDNSQGLFMVLRWLALVIGLVKAIIKFKQDGFQCSQDGLTAPQYEVLLSYLSTTTGSPFVIDPTADPLNPTYPSADTDLDSIVQQLLTSDQMMKKPASPDAAVEVTQEATFIMPDCISQQKELERAKVADWITDLNNLTS